MFLAHELHIPLDQVLAMSVEEFTNWLAYFQVRNELENKAANKANGK